MTFNNRALDKIRVAMDLLIEDGFMEEQETLKMTYDKYLHPDVLDYENAELWDTFGTKQKLLISFNSTRQSELLC